jgi:ribonuclease P protein component
LIDLRESSRSRNRTLKKPTKLVKRPVVKAIFCLSVLVRGGADRVRSLWLLFIDLGLPSHWAAGYGVSGTRVVRIDRRGALRWRHVTTEGGIAVPWNAHFRRGFEVFCRFGALASRHGRRYPRAPWTGLGRLPVRFEAASARRSFTAKTNQRLTSVSFRQGSPTQWAVAIAQAERESSNHEAYLSAEPDSAKAEARFSFADEDRRWSSRDQATTGQGPKASGRLRRIEVAMSTTGRFLRSERILRSRDFQRVGRSHRRAASRYFVVLVDATKQSVPDARKGAHGTDTASSRSRRLGITASRKVGNAVVRNRIKRAVREWFRNERDHLRDGTDILVIARRDAAVLRSPEVAATLHDQLLQALKIGEVRS